MKLIYPIFIYFSPLTPGKSFEPENTELLLIKLEFLERESLTEIKKDLLAIKKIKTEKGLIYLLNAAESDNRERRKIAEKILSQAKIKIKPNSPELEKRLIQALNSKSEIIRKVAVCLLLTVIDQKKEIEAVLRNHFLYQERDPQIVEMLSQVLNRPFLKSLPPQTEEEFEEDLEEEDGEPINSISSHPVETINSKIEKLYQEGKGYLNRQEYEEAGKIFKKMAKVDPNCWQWFFGFGLAKEAQDEYYKAEPYFYNALLRNPGDEEVRKKLINLYKEGRVEGGEEKGRLRALETINQGAQLFLSYLDLKNEEDFRKLLELINAYWELEEYRQIEKIYLGLIEEDPSNIKICLELAGFYSDVADKVYKKESEELQKEDKDKKAAIIEKRAIALKPIEEKQDEEIEKLEKEKESILNKADDPRKVEQEYYRKKLETTKTYEEQKKKIRDPFEKELKEIEEKYTLKMKIAEESLKEKKNKALIYYKKAFSQDPQNVDLLIRIADFCVDLKKYKEAQNLIEEALKINPQISRDVIVQYDLEKIQRELGLEKP